MQPSLQTARCLHASAGRELQGKGSYFCKKQKKPASSRNLPYLEVSLTGSTPASPLAPLQRLVTLREQEPHCTHTTAKGNEILTKDEAGKEEGGEGRANSVIFISKKKSSLKK